MVGIWPNANWYEREVWDLFGIVSKATPICVAYCCPIIGKAIRCARTTCPRATEFDPFRLNAAKQDLEQEALYLSPEEWGAEKGTENEDFMFLNLGPNHPSAHGAFPYCVAAGRRRDSRLCAGHRLSPSRRREKWLSAKPGTALFPTPTASTI